MQDSQWRFLNKKIKFTPTKKLFFGIYPYALYCEPVDSRKYPKAPFSKMFSISVAVRAVEASNENNKTDFKLFRCAIGFKVFSKSLEDLYTLASTQFDNSTLNLISVTRPNNNEELQLVKQGYILTKRLQTHPYILNIRSGFYKPSELKSLGTYIKSLQEQNEARISKTALLRLFNSRGYFVGCKISLKDKDVAVFMRLICPKIVGANQERITINT